MKRDILQERLKDILMKILQLIAAQMRKNWLRYVTSKLPYFKKFSFPEKECSK